MDGVPGVIVPLPAGVTPLFGIEPLFIDGSPVVFEAAGIFDFFCLFFMCVLPLVAAPLLLESEFCCAPGVGIVLDVCAKPTAEMVLNAISAAVR